MSNSEPPSRVPPRGQTPDTKAARDELSSKGKVEKVREVDADETRKQKFLKYYDPATESEEEETRPTPFDLISGKKPQATAPGALRGDSSDTEDAVVASPSYTPPPNVFLPANTEEGEEGEEAVTTGALPQSEDFWEDVDFPPDQPTPARSFQETAESTKKMGTEEPQKKGEATVPQGVAQKKGEAAVPQGAAQKKGGKANLQVAAQKKGEKMGPGPAAAELAAAKAKLEKKPEPSPFGLPGKPEKESPTVKTGKRGALPPPKEEKEKLPTPFESAARQPKPREAPKKLSPSEQAAAPSKPLKPGEERKEVTPSFAKETQPLARAPEKEEERYLGPAGTPAKQQKTEQTKEESTLYPEPGAVPFQAEEREGGSGGGGKRGRDQKITEIQSPSLPQLPVHVQPMAAAAATQAAPYIHASTMALFYQMVGTMYVMAGPQGISRTEIVLNNPSYAYSKFFGSTIRIEKYATAPDSFNITLSGSDAAVKSFKENIPSLMTAFQNGNFTFKVNRLDVEYTIERPVFRRKESSEEKRDAGGGDLGERRK